MPGTNRTRRGKASGRDSSSPPGLRSELRALLKLAVPVVLAELGWMAMSVVDTTMVGRLSPVAIGAVGLGSVLYNAIVLFAMGLLLGMDALVSRAFGAGRLSECYRLLYQGMFLAVVLTLPVIGLSWLLPPLLVQSGVRPEVASACAPFIRMLSLSSLPLLFYAALRRYLQGMRMVRPVMFALLSANLVNWVGNWVLIYGHWGFTPRGIVGSAVSTLLARIYMALVLAVSIWFYERRRASGLFHQLPRIELPLLGRMLRLGLPAASQILLEVGAFGAATVMAGRLMPAALAAHQIALNCASVTYMVPLGMSAATAVSVGHALGRQDAPAARRIGWMGIAVGGVFMSAAALVFLLAPRAIMRFYTGNVSVIAAGQQLLIVAAFFQLFDGLQTVTTGALRGSGNTRDSMIANFVSYWLLGLPLGYWLCFRQRWGAVGIWMGLSVSLTLLALTLMRLWQQRSNALVADEEPEAGRAASPSRA